MGGVHVERGGRRFSMPFGELHRAVEDYLFGFAYRLKVWEPYGGKLCQLIYERHTNEAQASINLFQILINTSTSSLWTSLHMVRLLWKLSKVARSRACG